MRDTKEARADLLAELRRKWPTRMAGAPDPVLVTDVELGLTLMAALSPELTVADGWTVFGGYPFAQAKGLLHEGQPDYAVKMALLRVARHYLWPMHRRRTWLHAIRRYEQLPSELRGYAITGDQRPPERLDPSIASGRWRVYAALLKAAPPYLDRSLPRARKGRYAYRADGEWHQITFPDDVPDVPMPAFDLAERRGRTRRPLVVPVDELQAIAHEVAANPEVRDGHHWRTRLGRVALDVLDKESGEFRRDQQEFRIDELLHLIGIPGIGKSTLRDIITTWAVRRKKLRVTLVVGDVADVLDLVRLFNGLGMRAAPVLGTTTRDMHVGRLHRRLAAKGYPDLLAHDDHGFDYLSTACAVDALRAPEETAKPLAYSHAPCATLVREGTGVDDEERKARGATAKRYRHHACPYTDRCPRHHGARELLAADIWVATPASLVQTAVPRFQNGERVRYLELACRRSDLIIVDEADRVQMQLDSMFAPSASLYRPGANSWLDELNRHNVAELAREGRVQLSEAVVSQWTAALDTVSTTANRLYQLLVSNNELRGWIRADYFNAWTLQQELINRWPASRRPEVPDDEERTSNAEQRSREVLARLDRDPEAGQDVRRKRREELLQIMDDFLDDPLGDGDATAGTARDEPEPERRPETAALVDLARRLVTNSPRNVHVQRRLRSLFLDLGGMAEPKEVAEERGLTETEQEECTEQLDRDLERFEFTLLVAVMDERLNLLTTLWPRVEVQLRLESSANELYHRSPNDYGPFIPESPMGNVLGFQFLESRAGRADGDSVPATGELRFFRCGGVGRELLTRLPQLALTDGLPGPNVLLMSGTSWAGASTRYHVLRDVGAVLRERRDEEDAAAPGPRIHLETLFFTTDSPAADGKGRRRPLRASGEDPKLRPARLREMVTLLAEPPGNDPDGQSLFARHLSDLVDDDRARLLVLVGSYDEADDIADHLHGFDRWRGKVCRLISDDADLERFERQRDEAPERSKRALALRRGDITEFVETGAQILVAPLLAVERGHNILKGGKAAFGAVYFLARPYPRPGDIEIAIQAMNDWTTRRLDPAAFRRGLDAWHSLDSAGLEFRKRARAELHRLLTRDSSWPRLTGADREYLTWDLLVVLWQVIGRLTRGGVGARVYFVDAAFAPTLAEGGRRESAHRSLLVSMRDVLAPYFDDAPSAAPPSHAAVPPPHRIPPDGANRYLVESLYAPLYEGLTNLLRAPGQPLPRQTSDAR
ncbi:signal recognition particle [Marinactinospora rubrisoli]|uniref:Signal recognition particle n=1 Tax=Marinactinospora rubrisoli TaxID=2715399 RepID=A0ABW2KH56_9ACTN